MCLYNLFHRKKMNELEKNPKQYIENLFRFLEDKGFRKYHRQVNSESWFDYSKDDFHISIPYEYNFKLKKLDVWFDIYYKTWDNDGTIKHLHIKDEHYKSRFLDYDNLNCKEKVDLIAEYLSEHIDDVMQANIKNSWN